MAMFKQLLLLFFSLCCAATNAQPLSTAQWKKDILTLQASVKQHHINPFHTISEGAFDQHVSQLLNKVPDLNEAEIEVQISHLLASIGDGHSRYNLMSGPHKHYPFNFQFFGEHLRVVAAAKPYQHLIGSELVAINQIKVSELQKKLKPYISGVDNIYSFKVRFAFQITIAKLLFGSGVSREQYTAKFTFKQNTMTSTHTVKAVTMHQFAQITSPFKRANPTLTWQPIKLDGIRFATLPAYDTVYIDFDHYPEPLSVITLCDAIQKTIRKSSANALIIDFRGNGGGNFYSGLALSSCLLPLDQFDWQNKIAVLIDHVTFSAAMSNAAQFKSLLNAQIIGTPSGGDPNHYSETHRLSLPHSHRRYSLSKRYYSFSSVSSDALYPDKHLTQSWDEYQQGIDQPLLSTLSLFKNLQR
ncbi:S41 family peptidase [Pseudoalteromonas citrea]|nr:S41 family peptidase [Pseudoalteromonas citrea]